MSTEKGWNIVAVVAVQPRFSLLIQRIETITNGRYQRLIEQSLTPDSFNSPNKSVVEQALPIMFQQRLVEGAHNFLFAMVYSQGI